MVRARFIVFLAHAYVSIDCNKECDIRVRTNKNKYIQNSENGSKFRLVYYCSRVCARSSNIVPVIRYIRRFSTSLLGNATSLTAAYHPSGIYVYPLDQQFYGRGTLVLSWENPVVPYFFVISAPLSFSNYGTVTLTRNEGVQIFAYDLSLSPYGTASILRCSQRDSFLKQHFYILLDSRWQKEHEKILREICYNQRERENHKILYFI